MAKAQGSQKYPYKREKHHVSTENITYAGFWKRVAAYLIDALILLIPSMILGGIIGFVVMSGVTDFSEIEPAAAGAEFLAQVATFIMAWLYFAVMESSSWRGTLGKRALSIQVSDANGEQISFGKASGRFFAKILSGLILLIGFIMVAFTARKQGLHDMIAGTLVTNRA